MALIFGCSGPTLTAAERSFFAAVQPAGFILFQRNCVDPQQIRDLTAEMRALTGRADTPILIDQEGGRVQRLRPPHWRNAPPAKAFATVYQSDPRRAAAAVRLNFRMIAADLADLGITVDCAPVLDIPVSGAHDIIGDRAYGQTVAPVIDLARAAMDGLMAGGVLPVIKHIPGHGRAGVDSHLACPIVEAAHQSLSVQDFAPFRALSDAPFAMTAHVVYRAIDPDRVATLSAQVIETVIRGEIGFDGVLMSDDVGMQALTGDFTERTRAALRAGCDLVLHCSGNIDEMTAVADGARQLDARGAARLATALQARLTPPPIDRDEAQILFDRLMAP